MLIEAGEAITVVHGGLFLYETREKLRPMLRKIQYRIRHGKTSIAIFGSGGTGKSTLGTLLSQPITQRLTPQPYATSITVEPYTLNSDHVVCDLLVAPGQQDLRDETWSTLRSRISAGKIRMVINVVSWGYHHFEPEGYESSRHFRTGDTLESFMERHTEASRAAELESLREIAPCIKDVDGSVRMITLVTKQDLWWSERDKVRSYYTLGAYNDIVDEIYHARRQRPFRHEYLFASLALQNMRSTPGELLATTTAGYDEPMHITHIEKLMAMISLLTTA